MREEEEELSPTRPRLAPEGEEEEAGDEQQEVVSRSLKKKKKKEEEEVEEEVEPDMPAVQIKPEPEETECMTQTEVRDDWINHE